jgi:hypothetical protein
VKTFFYLDYRGEKLTIGLDKNLKAVSNKQFKITSKTDFGFYGKGNELNYFNAKEDQYALKARPEKGKALSLKIIGWDSNKHIWNQTSTSGMTKVIYTINNLKPDLQYIILIEGKQDKIIKSSHEGTGLFEFNANKNHQKITLYSKII